MLLAEDIDALLGAVFMMAILISLVITFLLKFIFKKRLKLYWYFLISLVLIALLSFIIINNPDFFF
jgi:hypothetical protein